MGYSGGGPNMYKVGSKENNSPANFSDKAMMYMKKMPAMYGKPKMTKGDPPEKKYTAQDSTNFMGMWNRQKKDVKVLKNYLNKTKNTKSNGAARMDQPVFTRDRVYRRLDSLNASPFASTFAKRNFPNMYGKKKK